jgi:hypothetical protein
MALGRGKRVRIGAVTDSETPPLDYRIPDGCRDELLDEHGQPLPHAASLMAALQRLGPDVLQAAGRRRDTIFMQQGITFEVAGSDGEHRDRAWPLDLPAPPAPGAGPRGPQSAIPEPTQSPLPRDPGGTKK